MTMKIVVKKRTLIDFSMFSLEFNKHANPMFALHMEIIQERFDKEFTKYILDQCSK